jgi:predicted signal transduction protein with EAL and GGDEF domain
MRLAVDDAGADYANLQHILHPQPDLMKLDISFVRNVDADFSRRAFASAVVRFCADTGSELIAEGVQTTSERLWCNSDASVCYAQAFDEHGPMGKLKDIDGSGKQQDRNHEARSRPVEQEQPEVVTRASPVKVPCSA